LGGGCRADPFGWQFAVGDQLGVILMARSSGGDRIPLIGCIAGLLMALDSWS
jgi:hypothetical protein